MGLTVDPDSQMVRSCALGPRRRRSSHAPTTPCTTAGGVTQQDRHVRIGSDPNGWSAPSSKPSVPALLLEFGHRGDDCTFETLLRRHDLVDPVLWRVAAVVHEADLEDGRYDAPEAAGLDVVLRGLSMACPDPVVIELTGPVFDGLYEYFPHGHALVSVIASAPPARNSASRIAASRSASAVNTSTANASSRRSRSARCLRNTAWAQSTPPGVLPASPTADSSLDFSSLEIFTRPKPKTRR
jgi:Chromate resistance exported protein